MAGLPGMLKLVAVAVLAWGSRGGKASSENVGSMDVEAVVGEEVFQFDGAADVHEPGLRCCCPREEPLLKYVCIGDKKDEVFTPFSEKLVNDTEDDRIMSSGSNNKLLQMLTQEVRSIPVKTQLTSKCGKVGEGAKAAVETLASPLSSDSQHQAARLRYKGATWENFTITNLVNQGHNIRTKLRHIKIDNIVYEESHKELPSSNLVKCTRWEKTAQMMKTGIMQNVMGRNSEDFYCQEVELCQEYIKTHVCGWDKKTGTLFKRAGHLGGECLDDTKLRAKRLGGQRCPKEMYHRNSYTIRTDKGLRFCDCGGKCT